MQSNVTIALEYAFPVILVGILILMQHSRRRTVKNVDRRPGPHLPLSPRRRIVMACIALAIFVALAYLESYQNGMFHGHQFGTNLSLSIITIVIIAGLRFTRFRR